MAHRHTRYVPNVHARQTRLPRCKCDQHRRRRRRWYPSATVAVGHAEPLGSVAACAVFSSKPPKYPKLLHSICAPAFKDFREIMMATGHRAARVRTNAGESVGCIGLAGRRRSKRLDIFRRSILRNVAHLPERVRCDKPPVTPPQFNQTTHSFAIEVKITSPMKLIKIIY